MEASKIFNFLPANLRMEPFDVRNSFGLTHTYDIPFEESTGDVVCMKDEDCCAKGNTDFIWCEIVSSKCLSKIVEGGLIHPNFPEKACHCPSGKSSFINKGRCRCK